VPYALTIHANANGINQQYVFAAHITILQYVHKIRDVKHFQSVKARVRKSKQRLPAVTR